MSQFTVEEIQKIAHLARLDLQESDIPAVQENLNRVKKLVDQLQLVDTEGVTPMAHPLPNESQRFRPDEITEKNQREYFQTLTDQTQAGLYLVPQVIE